MVDDDDGVESPSLEPQTDSTSALPVKNRRWRRLRIVKHGDSFSLIFSPLIGIYGVGIRASGASRVPQD